MSETTPRPWEVTERQYSVYTGEPRWQIADVQHSGPFWTALVLNEDDARLIVRAVNAHKGLVEALDKMTTMARKGLPKAYISPANRAAITELIGQADAALAQAKENA